MAGLLTYD